MTAEENKALVRRLLEALNTGDEDTLDDLVSTDYVRHGIGRSDVAHWGTDRWKLVARHGAQYTIKNQIAEGDRVFNWITMRTNSMWLGVPGPVRTDEPIEFDHTSIECVAVGKLVEGWGLAPHWQIAHLLGVTLKPEDFKA